MEQIFVPISQRATAGLTRARSASMAARLCVIAPWSAKSANFAMDVTGKGLANHDYQRPPDRSP